MSIDRCSGKVLEGIAVRVTITSISSTPISSPSTAASHYAVAHVETEGGPFAVPYGPADFHFISSNGRTYDAMGTELPESSDKILAQARLVPGNEAQGDVIFEVPTGAGEVTYESEIDGNSATWPTSS